MGNAADTDIVLKHIKHSRSWLDKANASYNSGNIFEGNSSLSLARAELTVAWEEAIQARQLSAGPLARPRKAASIGRAAALLAAGFVMAALMARFSPYGPALTGRQIAQGEAINAPLIVGPELESQVAGRLEIPTYLFDVPSEPAGAAQEEESAQAEPAETPVPANVEGVAPPAPGPEPASVRSTAVPKADLRMPEKASAELKPAVQAAPAQAPAAAPKPEEAPAAGDQPDEIEPLIVIEAREAKAIKREPAPVAEEPAISLSNSNLADVQEVPADVLELRNEIERALRD